MRFSLGAALLCAASVVGATPMIDQDQSLTGSTALATFISGSLAQSFQQTHSNISGAAIFLQKDFGTSGDVTIALFATLADAQANKTPLRSGSGIGTQNSYFNAFWDPLPVNPGDLYFLVFTQEFPPQGAFTLGAAGIFGGDKVPGEAFQFFQPLGNADYTFRTYFDDGNAIPAPGTLALLGLAAAGIAFSRFRAAA